MKIKSALIALSLFAITSFTLPASGKDLETDVSEARQPFCEESPGIGNIQGCNFKIVSENSGRVVPMNLTGLRCRHEKSKNEEPPSPKADHGDPGKDKQATALITMKVAGPGLIGAGIGAGFGFEGGFGGAVLFGIIGGAVGLGLGMLRVVNERESEARKQGS